MPSKLKEYPVGTTKPTTDLLQPIASNFFINEGNADSDDDVANTINNSSLISFSHKGSIKVSHSEIGKGTTMLISLKKSKLI